MGSLAPGTRQPDPDAAIGDLGVLLPADEIDLGGADVSVAGELADLVHRRLVADGVVVRPLELALDVDAAPAQPV